MATKVTVRGNLDQALRKFKQKVARDGVHSEGTPSLATFCLNFLRA